MPRVTVLMPLFNGERHVGAAIESILRQTYRDFELVIVDDGSTDQSRQIARSYQDPRIRILVNDRNIGLAASLNRGLTASHGELIARQDNDDLSDPERLDRQVAMMAARPELALLGSQADAIGEDGRALKPVDRPIDEISIRWYGLFDNPFVHTSVMFRRALVWDDDIHGYPELAYAEDYALWSSVMRRYPVANLADRLVTFRVRSTSKMGSLEDMSPDGRRSTGFPEIVRRLVRDNIVSAFGSQLSDDEATLMAGFVLGVPVDRLDRFLTVFHRLLALYTTRDPAFRRTPDFDRTLARQFDAIACRVTPPGRRAALRVYATVLRSDPAVAYRLSWLRAAALLLFGCQGRARVARPFRAAFRGGRSADVKPRAARKSQA
jgi:hypothetical protein